MSEFKCPESDCDYHVGISNGPNLTEEDWETEQHYFQEIEEHQQMHKADRDLELGSRIKEHERAYQAFQEAKAASTRAADLAVSAAVAIADQVVTTGSAANISVAIYSEDKTLAEETALSLKEAWAAYREAYLALSGQEMQKPPAGATAEGDETKHSNGK